MIKVKILSVGKTKEKWLEDAIQEYLKRLQGVISFDFIWSKDDATLIQLAEKEPVVIVLDPEGKHFTSEQFSKFFCQKFEESHSRLSIVIGGANGLPSSFKQKHALVSLSPLTFTHQITRLILIEQIYRAMEIARGSSYHK